MSRRETVGYHNLPEHSTREPAQWVRVEGRFEERRYPKINEFMYVGFEYGILNGGKIDKGIK